jgi:hypothetical protein
MKLPIKLKKKLYGTKNNRKKDYYTQSIIKKWNSSATDIYNSLSFSNNPRTYSISYSKELNKYYSVNDI